MQVFEQNSVAKLAKFALFSAWVVWLFCSNP